MTLNLRIIQPLQSRLQKLSMSWNIRLGQVKRLILRGASSCPFLLLNFNFSAQKNSLNTCNSDKKNNILKCKHRWRPTQFRREDKILANTFAKIGHNLHIVIISSKGRSADRLCTRQKTVKNLSHSLRWSFRVFVINI